LKPLFISYKSIQSTQILAQTSVLSFQTIFLLACATMNLRTVDVTRYVTPLREGGSLPAIVEADDGFLYVLKFRGAGQGIKALIAELLGGEIARTLGFRVPEIVFANVDPAFGRTEPDEEIQDLLKFSEGLNLALHYLSGAISFDPVVTKLDAYSASKIVWLDAFITNVDRTARNTNMLVWQKELWLIDHGAALYFHHAWNNSKEASLSPFTQVKDHVLLPYATELKKADEEFRSILNEDVIKSIVSLIPLDWLQNFDESVNSSQSVETVIHTYEQFLINRLNHSAIFLNQALHAREVFI
jgi:hypothetical protein